MYPCHCLLIIDNEDYPYTLPFPLEWETSLKCVILRILAAAQNQTVLSWWAQLDDAVPGNCVVNVLFLVTVTMQMC